MNVSFVPSQLVEFNINSKYYYAHSQWISTMSNDEIINMLQLDNCTINKSCI